MRPSPSPIPPRTRPPTDRRAQARRSPPRAPWSQAWARPRSRAPRPPPRSRLDGESFELHHGARGDRGHHQLHQHLQPVRDGRRGHPRAQRTRARPALQAVGQDLARARLEGGHRVPRSRRPDRAAGAARLQPRGLRLHDLHRQLRSAARAGLRGRQRGRPRRRLRALRQPQLRGAHQPRGEDELPRLAAAVRGLRARGHDGHGHRARPPRPGRARQRRLPTDIWPSEQEVAQTIGEALRADMFRRSYGEVFEGDERWNSLPVPEGERFAWDPDRPTCAFRPTSRTCPPSRRRCATCTTRACSRCSVTASRPTTSRPLDRSSATAPPASTCRRRASSRATSTPTARGAETTR